MENAHQCSVLLINPPGTRTAHRAPLQRMGFLVTEVRDWPVIEWAAHEYHVVIVLLRNISAAPMLAARLCAKPRFGRRVLIALVPALTGERERLTACSSGFDDVLNDDCESRQLIARILRRLRTRPELRCLLPPADKRRSAA